MYILITYYWSIDFGDRIDLGGFHVNVAVPFKGFRGDSEAKERHFQHSILCKLRVDPRLLKQISEWISIIVTYLFSDT